MPSALLSLESILDGAFDILLFPFESLPRIAGLFWISALAGAFLALIFRLASDQGRIGRERRLMGGITAGLLLHIQDPMAVLGIAFRLFAANLRYLLAITPALLLASVPFMVFLGQVEGRFCFEAPSAGDTILVTFEGRSPLGSSQISSSGAASTVAPFFLSGDGRTAACRIAFTGPGPAVVGLEGAELVVGRAGSVSPVGRALASGLSVEALLRPDVGVSRVGGISGEATLRTKRYPAFRTGLSGVFVFLAVSTLSAVATGAALRISV
jgi:hypothetical protein